MKELSLRWDSMAFALGVSLFDIKGGEMEMNSRKLQYFNLTGIAYLSCRKKEIENLVQTGRVDPGKVSQNGIF